LPRREFSKVTKISYEWERTGKVTPLQYRSWRE
jgi:hypothetical protein